MRGEPGDEARAAPIMLKFFMDYAMLHCSRNVTIMLNDFLIMLNDFLIMLTLAQVLTQLHVFTYASLSLRNRDMTSDVVVGPVVCSLRLLLSVSNTCFSLPSQPFTIV